MKQNIRTTSACRVWGHQWEPHRAQKSGHFWEVILLCSRECEVERHQTVSARSGVVVKTSYKYNDPTYLMKEGGPVTPEEKQGILTHNIGAMFGGKK